MRNSNGRLPKLKDSLAKWALYYRSLGWAVIPLDEGGSKEPKIKWKKFQAKFPTKKEILRWWTKWPKANIGILTGKASGGLYVLDIDGPEGRKRIEKYGGVPLSPSVETTRGSHVYFKEKIHSYRSLNRSKKEGWELKGEGGCVTAPPSKHHSGKQYTWTIAPREEPFAPVPRWLRKILDERGQSKEEELERLVVSYWVKGQRQEFAVGLAGFLCKTRWPWPMARHLFETVGTMAKDEEMPSRIKALAATYRKWQRGATITGYDKLEGILQTDDLKRLVKLARIRRIPPKIREIDSIRLQPGGKEGKPQWFKDREVCETIINDLKKRGRFLQVEKGPSYWFNNTTKAVIVSDSEEMRIEIDVTYGINPAKRLMEDVIASLRTEASQNGEIVQVYRFAHYDSEGNILYVYAGESLVYRLDGHTINTQDNGAESIFFEEVEREACWTADFENPVDPKKILIDDLSFDIGEDVILSPEYQRKVLWLYLRTLFFEEEQPTKPILVATGDPKGGKTTALRRILQLFGGPDANVSVIVREDAWEPAVSTHYFLVIDNVDKRLKWMPEKLDTLSTGQIFSIRKLYETNVEYQVKPRCFAALTTIHPPFQEGAVVSRFIILRMKPFKNFISEKRLKGEVIRQRNRLWAGLLNQLNEDVKFVKGEDIETTFRLADWGNLIAKFLRQEEDGMKTYKIIISGLEQEQTSQVLGETIVPQILEEWENSDPSRWYSAAELFNHWKRIAEEQSLTFFKSARGLSFHLANIREALGKRYGIKYRSDRRVYLYQFPGFSPKKKEESPENDDDDVW